MLNGTILGCVDCARALLTVHNVEINVQNKLGDTPLHNAAWKGHAEVVALLLEKGMIIIALGPAIYPRECSFCPLSGCQP
jgi:ankyrin repeat protein